MCQVIAYRSRTCGHRWLTITKSCGPGIGFTTHPQHEFKGRTSFFGGPKFFDASANSCPNCDLKGQYNGNTTRMVLASGERECERRTGLMGAMLYPARYSTAPRMCRQPVVPESPVYGVTYPYIVGQQEYLPAYGGLYPVAPQRAYPGVHIYGQSAVQAYPPAGYIMPR